ncbi:MAG: hypothetical protein O3B73_09070 [bacterium]|nr:hypothetical protein [bacterium]
MDTHKISVKVNMDAGQQIAPAAWFKTFNKWISANQGPEVLIDVADYSHVKNGPVTLLVGHEYDISIDDAGGSRGLLFSRKKPHDGDFGQRLTATVKKTLEICRRIETDGDLGETVTFRGGELNLILNDRLHAPNTDDTFKAVQPEINALLKTLFGGAKMTTSRPTDPRARFSVDVRIEGRWPIEKLLANL